MTLLSNVFRSFSTVTSEAGARHIGIRDLKPKIEPIPEDHLTIESVYVERDRILEEAYKTIESEKLHIENTRQTATEDIAKMQGAWKDEKIALEQRAYDEAFQMGHEEGRNKAISEMNSSIELANNTTSLSATNASQYIAGQERVILELAMQTAERIIGQTIEEDEEKFVSVVQRAIKETREMKEIRLYVSTKYFKLISENRAELASIFPPDTPFLIFVNEEFDSTECYVETNHGRLVVSVDEQLNVLREQLIEIMESGD